jgi:hypothetical protein
LRRSYRMEAGEASRVELLPDVVVENAVLAESLAL